MDRGSLARAELDGLGVRLRGLRGERGWTLEELAGRSGLSKAYLSRIEGGGRQPSLAALFELARVYGVPVSELLGEEPEDRGEVVVRSGDAPMREGRGLRYAALSSGGGRFGLQPLRVVVPAGREGEELYRHEGEEWLYVLSGRLRLGFGGEEHLLEAGDAAHFDAGRPHRLEAVGGRDAELVLVAAPQRSLLRSYL